MPEDLYQLTADDVAALRDLLRSARIAGMHRVFNASPRQNPALEPIGPNTPDVYVALTPVAGIPGLQADTLGTGTGTGTGIDDVNYADCEVFRVDSLYNPPELIDQQFTRTVYNISRSALPGSTYVQINRDKFGTWIAVPSAGQGNDVYIVLTPPSGIPALGESGTGTGTGVDDPGEAGCQAYQIVTVNKVPEMVPIVGKTLLVYNTSQTAIPGNEYIVAVQDFYGKWLAVPQQGSGGGTAQPSCYAALVPAGGIPGLGESGTGTGTGVDDPGSAVCKLFQINTTVVPPEMVHTGLTETVYNFNRSAVRGNVYIPIVKDAYGDWLAAVTTSPLTTKGDLWGFGTTDVRLPVGTNGSLLGSNSTASTGLAYYGLTSSNGSVTITVNTGANTIDLKASSSSSVSPGGANTDVQFNDSGAFGGVTSFTFVKSTATLTVDGASSSPSATSATIIANSTGSSTSTIKASGASNYVQLVSGGTSSEIDVFGPAGTLILKNDAILVITSDTGSLQPVTYDADGDVNVSHSGGTVGFLGKGAAAQQTGGAATAGATYTATEQSMLQKAYDALRTFGFLS